jgi:DNA primase
MFADAKEQVRQATDIADLVGRYIELRRQGRLYVGRCKWHDDRKPSLTVNPQRGTWKCWVCDIGGDAFSFVMKAEGCDFKEALQMLADRAGITLAPGKQKKAEPGSPDDKNTLYDCCAWAAKQFHEFLLNGEPAESARQYVEERAITPLSVERFGVGYAPPDNSWLLNRARNTPYSPAVLEAAGLVSKYEDSGSYRDFFRGRLIFPIRDTQGRPVGFGGRILPQFASDRTGKYFNPRETRLYTKSNTLYGLDIAKQNAAQSRSLTIVEGYTDVILCHQHGVGDVIACCGTAVTEGHIRLLKRFADTIYLVLDGDAAGQRRTNELLQLFVAAQVDLRILTLPDELDPAEFVIERGGESFRALLAGAKDALEHKIDVATRGIDLARDTHRANQALEDVLGTIVVGLSGEQHDAFSLRIKQFTVPVARRFAMEVADVQHRLAQLRKTVKRPVSEPVASASAPAYNPYKAKQLSPHETELLEILMLHPEIAGTALAEIADDDLPTPAAREVLQLYRSREETGLSLDFPAVLADVEDPQVKNLLVELDELAQSKSAKALLDGPTRLRSVIRQFHSQHELRELKHTEAALEQGLLDSQEELDVLSQMIAAKRRQQGLIENL